MTMLFTIGYEGSDLQSLIGVLSANGVDEVIDVRLTPISRKPGFSKSALAKALAEEGIAYQHHRDLGCPKEIRVRYWATRDFRNYAQAYRHRVLDGAAQCVHALVRRATSRRLCLLCFEENPLHCHRSLVAEETRRASRGEVHVDHLGVPSSGRTCRQR